MVLQDNAPERWDIEVDLVAMGASSGGLAAVIKGYDRGTQRIRHLNGYRQQGAQNLAFIVGIDKFLTELEDSL